MKLANLFVKKRFRLSLLVFGGLVIVLLLVLSLSHWQLFADTNPYASFDECVNAYTDGGASEEQAFQACNQYIWSANDTAPAAINPDQPVGGLGQQASEPLPVPEISNNNQLPADQTVGRIRIAKEAWHWNWPEYGDSYVEGVNPVVIPLYSNLLLDPVRYASSDPNYANFLHLTSTTVHGLAGQNVSFTCSASGNRPLIKQTDSNGFAEISWAELQELGCKDFAAITANLVLPSSPSAGSASFNYFFPERQRSVLAVSQEQSFANTVFVANRPTVLGKVINENNQAVPNAVVCLFYRQPATGEACNKPGLSVGRQADAGGYFQAYASWGDYQQKGGGARAYLTFEGSNGRQICSQAFAIESTSATEVNCVINSRYQAPGRSTSSTRRSTGGLVSEDCPTSDETNAQAPPNVSAGSSTSQSERSVPVPPVVPVPPPSLWDRFVGLFNRPSQSVISATRRNTTVGGSVVGAIPIHCPSPMLQQFGKPVFPKPPLLIK